MRETIAEALSDETQPFVDDGSDDRRRGFSDGFPARGPSPGRRASRRWRVLLSALIVDPNSDLVIPCRAENVSDNGARIKLDEAQLLPSSFWLIAVTAGLAYRARTIWRQQDRLGVEVGEPVHLEEATSIAERRLHKIWTIRR